MVQVTLRLDRDIESKLQTLADALGIVKTHLITFALNDHLLFNHEVHDLTPSFNTAHAMTYRIPDHLHKRLTDLSKTTGLSINGMINYVVNLYVDTMLAKFAHIIEM